MDTIVEKKPHNMLGKKHSPETKAKISKAQTGKKPSEDTRAKMSKAHIGLKLSEEAKAKISKARTGKKHSAETKAKVSKAHYNTKKSKEARAKMSEKGRGKVVSEETKNKISSAGKRRLISVEGIPFKTVKEAAVHFGLTKECMRRRLDKGLMSSVWETVHPKRVSRRRRQKTKPTTVSGEQT